VNPDRRARRFPFLASLFAGIKDEMFRFKFELLLKHRRHEEENARRNLFAAQMTLRSAQERMRRIKKERRHCILRLQQRQAGKLDTAAITLALDFINRLTAQLEEAQGAVFQAEKLVTIRHRELVKAVKRRKTLEKLKEKERQRYQRELIRQETKFMDEVAVNRHARQPS
jgi:flagellar FliJ protein